MSLFLFVVCIVCMIVDSLAKSHSVRHLQVSVEGEWGGVAVVVVIKQDFKCVVHR